MFVLLMYTQVEHMPHISFNLVHKQFEDLNWIQDLF